MADVTKAVKEYAEDLWWLFVLEGVVTVLFGIVALFWPGLTLVTLVYLFAIYIVVWGLFEIFRGLVQISRVSSWWVSLLFGLVATGVGVYLLRNPHIAAQVFVTLIGAVILARGVVDLYVAGFVAQKTENRVLWALTGILGIIAAIVMWSYPLASSLAFVWVLGLYALFAGVFQVAFALRVRDEVVDVVDDVKGALKSK